MNISKWISSNLSRKLSLIILSCFCLAIFALASTIVWTNYRDAKEDLKARAAHAGALASGALITAIWDMNTEGVEETAKALMLDKEMIYLKVYNVSAKESLIKTRGIGAEVPFEDLVNKFKFPNTKIDIEKEDEAIAVVDIVMTDEKIIARSKTSAIYVLILSTAIMTLIVILMTLILKKVIKKPLLALGNNAARISAGELDHEIDTSRPDELGNLARSFSDMQKSIRKKISDLFSLNEAGEEIMASQTQDEVMSSFIKKFQEHNHFSFGSVYLYDKEENVLKLYMCNAEADSSKVIESFKVGEGVIGRTAQEKKVVFIKDTSLEADFVKSDGSGRALLCVPMTDGDELFGVMNYSGAVEQVVFEDSDIEYCETIARLSVSRIKGLQMIALIEEQNRTLEIKVQERTASLREKTNDINAMLQNMKQGIFTITDEHNIHHEYSAQLETILETDNIANQPVLEAIFKHTDIGMDQLDQIVTAMNFSFGADDLNWDCNCHVFPTEAKYTAGSGVTKIIECDWNPIFDDDEMVTKIIVTVRDVTQLKELEKESEAQKKELSIIGEILNVSQKRFNSFLDVSKDFIHKNESIIQSSREVDDPSMKERINELFRNMHTIKGNARAFGLSGLTDVVHNAEQFYDDIRKGEKEWHPDQLKDDVAAVKESLKNYEVVFAEKLSGRDSEAHSDGLHVEDKEAVFGALVELSNVAGEMDKYLLDKVIRIIDGNNFVPIEDCLSQILNSLPQLAKDLGKEEPQVSIRNGRTRLPAHFSSEFENIFSHLFRNSLDHGIETLDQRRDLKKPEKPNIMLIVEEGREFLNISFYDDGRGLNIPKIEEIARERGLLKGDHQPNDDEIAEAIFSPGFSIADQVTDISGRGVGLDAVRSFLADIDGEIKIVWLESKDRTEEGCKPFKFEIHIKYHPENMAA